MPVISYYFFIILALFTAEYASAVDKSRLWLPIAYEKEYNRLLDAAKKLDSLGICYRLVSGRLSESRSAPNKLVFVFRCRDENRVIHPIYVGAERLNIIQQRDVWFKEDEEKKREKLRQLLADRDRYWFLCVRKLEEQLADFNQPRIVGKGPSKPDVTPEGHLLYLIEFTSISSETKETLSYLATAIVDTIDKCEVTMKPINIAE